MPDDFTFDAYVQNLSSYTRHIHSGATLSFPTTTEAVQRCLAEIGVDGLRCEEIIITDYKITVPGIRPILGEFASIDELNYLAHRIQGMSETERVKFVAAVKHGEYGGNITDAINLTYNLDCYDLLSSVMSYEDYGQYLVDNRRDFYIPQKARFYFDYESYGRDTVINEGGDLTPYGYIWNNQSPFQEVYDGDTIPKEYRVFQYPMQARARQGHEKSPGKSQVR